jgi:curli production assembly/transport component CsgG/holdfast attachment protein HfaB
MHRKVLAVTAAVASLALGGCVSTPEAGGPGVKPVFTYAVTNNDTPYSQCLASWKDVRATHGLPRISVGEIADKTGQVNFDDSGHALSQGASEMVMSRSWSVSTCVFRWPR